MIQRPWAAPALAALLLISGLATPGQAAIDPTDEWVHGPLDEKGLPLYGPQGGQHFRLSLDVALKSPAMAGAQGIPVTANLDLAHELAEAGYPVAEGTELPKGFRLDLDSFRLVEVDAAGVPFPAGRDIPVQVLPGTLDSDDEYQPTRPTVTLRWTLAGATEAPRHFHVYFDAEQNGDKPERPLDLAARNALSAAIGPGRGTRFYVPLYDIPTAQGAAEARMVRVTNLSPGVATVSAYEYDASGNVATTPSGLPLVLNGLGATGTYRFGNNGGERSFGFVMLESDALVSAEAMSGSASSTQFLPAETGGFVGARFTANALRPETWAVFCPNAQPTPVPGCTFSVAGQTRSPGGLNTMTVLPIPAGVTTLVATRGVVAVQRMADGLAAWPPLDGGASSALHLGYAKISDRVHILQRAVPVTVQVQSYTGSSPLLDPNLRVPGQGYDVGWDQVWPQGSHGNGHARVSSKAVGTPVAVQSGRVDPFEPNAYGYVVSPVSPDGGFTYDVYVPATTPRDPEEDPVAIGDLWVFAPYSGTIVEARRVEADRVVTESHNTPLEPHQVTKFEGAGTWHLAGKSVSGAPRPIVVSLVNAGSDDFSGLVPAVTDAVSVEVTGLQFAGYLFDLGLGEDLFLAKAGDSLEVPVTIKNLGRTAAGQPVADDVRLTMTVPQGWGKIVSSAPIPLAADGAGSQVETQVKVIVPESAKSGQGVDVVLEGSSAGNPGLRVQETIRIRFEANRRVTVLADGQDAVARKAIKVGESATYEIMVQNAGTVVDSYTIDCPPAAEGWAMTFTPPICAGGLGHTAQMESGAILRSFLTIRPTVATATQFRFLLSATSEDSSSVKDSVSVVTSLGVDRSFRVEFVNPTRTVDPGKNTTFDLRVVNEADANEDLRVTVSSQRPPGWDAPNVTWVGVGRLEDAGNAIGIEPRGSTLLRVVQAVPENATPLQIALNRIVLQSKFNPDNAGVQTDLRVLASRIDRYTATLSPALAYVVPGQPFRVTVRLESTANIDQALQFSPLDALGWEFRDASGRGPPWLLPLVAHGNRTLTIDATGPLTLPPGREAAPLTFEVGATGTAPRRLLLALDVAERRGLEVSEQSLTLAAGLDNVVDVPARNTGNVPLNLTASWSSLPPGWHAGSAQAVLALGAGGNLTFHMAVPAGATSPGRGTLRVADESGTLLAEAILDLEVGKPDVRATLQSVQPIGHGHAVYRLQVENRGDASAYLVELRLESGGQVADRVVLLQVRPGATPVANLVGPDGGDDLALRLVTAADPEGTLLAADLPADGKPGALSRLTPGPGVSALAAVALCAALLRRRRA